MHYKTRTYLNEAVMVKSTGSSSKAPSIRFLALLSPVSDHVPASHAAKAKSCVHRPDFVHVTTRTSQDDGFIKIGAGFIVHGFSLFPARRFLIMHFRAGYSSIGEPQKITMYSPGRRRQFYNFIVSNGIFLILVKLSRTYYEPWYVSYHSTCLI